MTAHSRRRFVLAASAAATGLILLGGALPARAADVTLNALFMKQASYSEDNIRDMTADFEKANPGTKVTTNWIQSDYEQKLQTSIAAGTQSTVMEISNTSLAGFAPSFAVTFEERNQTIYQLHKDLPLDDLLAESEQVFRDIMFQLQKRYILNV